MSIAEVRNFSCTPLGVPCLGGGLVVWAPHGTPNGVTPNGVRRLGGVPGYKHATPPG